MANVQSGSSAIIRRIERRSAAGLATDTLDGEESHCGFICLVVISLSTTNVGDLAGDITAECILELDGLRFEVDLLDCADFILLRFAVQQQTSCTVQP